MAKFPLKIVDDTLKKIFFKLGVAIGHNPGYFIIVPILLTALCASGFQRMNYNWDPEYLFSPTNGPAKAERAIMEKYFPVDYEYFHPQRMSRVGKFGRLIITPSNGGSLLKAELWDDLIYLESLIYNITVSHEGMDFQYEDICVKWAGYCKTNNILNLVDIMPEIERHEFNLTYPLTFDPVTFEQYSLPATMGGIEVTDIGTVTSVEAVSLNYFLDVTSDWQVEVGLMWEREFLATIDRYESDMPNLFITRFVSSTPAWEMEASKNSITPNLLINVGFMVLFCLAASSMSDAVRSKPLLGFLGLVSAVLATLAGFGLGCYLGVEFTALCLAAPFLLFGIGIDDTFVMISAWRRSPTHSTIPERMGLAYSEAAVSITVTSLTDFLGFMAGVITPFPCVRIFCIYTGIAVAFIYVWQLTFFGAFLALSGYSEKNNKHGMVPCYRATPKSQATHHNWLFKAFCTGGINPSDPYNPVDNKDHAGMVFLRDKLGYALNLKWVKSIVLIVFTAYLVVAVWGISNLKEGLEKRNTVNGDSYVIAYYDMDDKYYKDFRYPINIIITGNIDYSQKRAQQRIKQLITRFENSTHIAENMSTSWLQDFLGFVERNKMFYGDQPDMQLEIDNEKNFVSSLRDVYLSDQENDLMLDVNFDGDHISSARFMVQGFKVDSATKETAMITELRQISKEFSTENFQVTVFHPFFIYIDQYLEIRPQTIQSILVTSGFMMIVSFIMIPNPICSLWVAFSIISIEAGVVGYMTWWGVNLDGISLINLIMCIGFSVDFTAHICYHYMSEEEKTPEERISASLYALGIPIIQGAVSTILGVIGLALAPSYVYVTFFKMVFLVIFLGAAHGLILLPVLLSLFGPGSCAKDSDTSNISTPSTTVSLHSTKQPSCYTVNLGFGTPGEYRHSKDPHQNHLNNIDHFQRRVPAGVVVPGAKIKGSGSPNLRQLGQSEFNPGSGFTFVTRITDEHINNSSQRAKPNNDSRLAPVPESEEQQHNQHMDAVVKRLNKHHKNSCKKQENISKPQVHVDHKKICRSKSHRPQTQTVGVGGLDRTDKMDKLKGAKQPLRKYNSFPYHVFINEAGYSSDDSVKSAIEEQKR